MKRRERVIEKGSVAAAGVFFRLLGLAAIVFIVFVPSALAGQEDPDEITALKKQIRDLRVLVRDIIRTLPPEQQKKMEPSLTQAQEVETAPTSERGEEHFSETARRLNRIKQELELLKKKVEKLGEAIHFAGHMDVSASGYKENPNVFKLGDFEFSMEKSFGSFFQAGAAFVFNDEGASLSVGFIDYHLFGGKISPRGRLFSQKGLHFQAGRFDIPFGNDWQYFASIDRFTVTAPMTTEWVLNGGYNDVGLRILGNAISFNYSLFCVRGVGEGVAAGGRLGFTPFNNPFTLRRKVMQKLELGVSFLSDWDRAGDIEEKAFSLDGESSFGPVRFQAEYVRRESVFFNQELDGWHFSGFVNGEGLWPVTLCGRIEAVRCKAIAGEDQRWISRDRLSIGVHVGILDVSILKLEYLTWLKGDEDHSGSSIFLQLALIF